MVIFHSYVKLPEGNFAPGASRDVLAGLVPPKALLAGLLGDPSLNAAGAVNGAGLVDTWDISTRWGHQKTPSKWGPRSIAKLVHNSNNYGLWYL